MWDDSINFTGAPNETDLYFACQNDDLTYIKFLYYNYNDIFTAEAVDWAMEFAKDCNYSDIIDFFRIHFLKRKHYDSDEDYEEQR